MQNFDLTMHAEVALASMKINIFICNIQPSLFPYFVLIQSPALILRYLKSIHTAKQRAKQEVVLRMHLKWPGNLIHLRNSSRRLSPVPRSPIHQDGSFLDQPNHIYGPNYLGCSRPADVSSNKLEVPVFEPGFNHVEAPLVSKSSSGFNSKLQTLHEEEEEPSDDRSESKSCESESGDFERKCEAWGFDYTLVNFDKLTTRKGNLCESNNLDVEEAGPYKENISVKDSYHFSYTNEKGHLGQGTYTPDNEGRPQKMRRQGVCYPLPKIHQDSASDYQKPLMKTPLCNDLHQSWASSLNLSDIENSDFSEE